jgi:serine/arginine repetitive matrix protein 1
LKPRKQPKKLAAKRNKNGYGNANWKSSDGGNALSGAEVEGVVAAEVETLTDVAAVSVFRNGLPDENSTPTFPQARAGTVALQGHRAAPVLHPPLVHHPLVANAIQVETETGVADRLAALYHQTETGGQGDVAPITVIELDPFLAVIHRAHVLPEETDGHGDPFLPAVHLVHLLPGTGAEKTLV